MKKYLAMFLALVMMLSLAACGGNSTDSSASSESDEPAKETAAAPEEPGSAEITLSMSCFDTAGSFNDLTANAFMDKVKEVSNGAISFQFYQNGTYCSLAEDYDFVCAGSLDCS